jgi:hypothetical protein
MNTRPTPETAAAIYTATFGTVKHTAVHPNVAIKLERERDEAREEIAAMREAIMEAHEALEGCQEDTCELIAERDWWKNEPRCGYSARWAEMNVRFAKAVAALAKLKPFLP